jgi:hypothetical protein
MTVATKGTTTTGASKPSPAWALRCKPEERYPPRKNQRPGRHAQVTDGPAAGRAGDSPRMTEATPCKTS